MVYIHSSSCISIQPTFDLKNIGASVSKVSFPLSVKEPDYSNLISPALIRRMSPILKYGVATAIDCLNQSGIATPDAIITGTGLGCLNDTRKFMEAIIQRQTETLSPTSFIQSTHNTVSGQIALQTGCHGYNMTYVQNGLSFEHALSDAFSLVNENIGNVLVGGMDEKIPLLDEVGLELGVKEAEIQKLTAGSTFFLLNESKDKALCRVIDVQCETTCRLDMERSVELFLKKNNCKLTDIDCLVYGLNSFDKSYTVEQMWTGSKVNYIDYCGYYFTNSAFGMFLAVQMLNGIMPIEFEGKNTKYNKILVLNNYQNRSLGLILINKIEN